MMCVLVVLCTFVDCVFGVLLTYCCVTMPILECVAYCRNVRVGVCVYWLRTLHCLMYVCIVCTCCVLLRRCRAVLGRIVNVRVLLHVCLFTCVCDCVLFVCCVRNIVFCCVFL